MRPVRRRGENGKGHEVLGGPIAIPGGFKGPASDGNGPIAMRKYLWSGTKSFHIPRGTGPGIGGGGGGGGKPGGGQLGNSGGLKGSGILQDICC